MGRFRAQMEVQYLPALDGEQDWEYKISVIHLATRMKYSEIHPELSTERCADVLSRACDRLPPFFVLWTDNPMYFTMRFTPHPERLTAFQKRLAALKCTHALIPPGQPWRNGFIERSNRTDNDECFHTSAFASSDERRYYFRLWEDFYNHHRPHHALDFHTSVARYFHLFPAHSAFLS